MAVFGAMATRAEIVQFWKEGHQMNIDDYQLEFDRWEDDRANEGGRDFRETAGHCYS